jgi:hypothetical protein
MLMDTGFFEYGVAAVLGAVGAVALTIWTFLADGMSGGLGKGE